MPFCEVCKCIDADDLVLSMERPDPVDNNQTPGFGAQKITGFTTTVAATWGYDLPRYTVASTSTVTTGSAGRGRGGPFQFQSNTGQQLSSMRPGLLPYTATTSLGYLDRQPTDLECAELLLTLRRDQVRQCQPSTVSNVAPQ